LKSPFSQNSDLRNLELDLGSGYTAYHRVSLIDLYLVPTNQISFKSEKNFLWTDREVDLER